MAFTHKQLLLKMWKNGRRALKEHKEKTPFFQRMLYLPLKEVSLSSSGSKLQFTCTVEALQGKRPRMEDRHFCLENEKGMIVGVLDGHNGSAVADYAAHRFTELFFTILDQWDDNVYQAFASVFYCIQDEIERFKTEWDFIGSTAVVCYLEKKSGYIYTATLGDSSASLYRIFRKKRRVLPLSCIRNWSSPRDFASAKTALGEELPYREDPKEMRHPPPGVSVHFGIGLNVSRALGDAAFKGVIHLPKLTLTTLKKGDIILLACDGLKDFATEKEILSVINLFEGKPGIVKGLVDYAFLTKDSTDNITVLGVFM